MEKDKHYASLKKFSLELGIDLFGVADISQIKNGFLLSEETKAGADKAVCLGVSLSRGILGEIQDAPTRLYFHHYKTVNTFLDQAALKVNCYIQRKGYTAIPVAASQIVDWQNQRAHLSHRQIGYLAGLGWIGRNNLLVNKKLGAQFRLVSILTNMPLKLDQPCQESCGFCRLCIEVCPARAIKPDVAAFERLKCLEKLKEFQRQRLTDQYICGVCINVCKGGLR